MTKHQEHEQKVSAIADTIRGHFEAKRPFRIYHGSTNSTRILSFKRSEMIDVSQLNNVLSVDTKSRTAWVEPNVPMDRLITETLKHGLVPPVVMEFPGITVGGGIQGGGGESSSFRYGCFNEICNRYEMILASGEVVEASPTKHADLFHATAGSFGTLGVITAAEVRLIPAKQYVQLTYLPVSSFDDAVNVLKQTAKQSYDYIDGIMFGADHGVIIVGILSDEIVGKVERFTRAYDEWYYLHAQKIDARRAQFTETIPLADYLFRYDRGAFWVGHNAFQTIGWPFTRFNRWLLDHIMHTRKLYEALQESGISQQFIVQDLALPQATAVEFMNFVDTRLGIYPLWLCPLKPDSKSPLQLNNLRTPLCINIGVWGKRITDRAVFLKANRDIEKTVAKLGGKKWFYAHSYYTEKEFWSRYDRAWYDKLRQKYHATSLPTVYDKIRVKDTYPVDLKRGALRTIFGTAKLRIKD